MEHSRLSLKRSLLTAFVAVSLLSTTGMAQRDTSSTSSTRLSLSTPSGTTTKSTTSTTSTSTTSSLPKLSGTGTTTESKLTGLPTLSKTANTAIPTYPAPSVPPTENAPFMNHSTLPDGTVFIAVGAILGAFGVAVLVWRGIVACLLHRSVERAAMAQHAENDKANSFPPPPAPFYKYSDRGSSPSLAGGPAAGRGVRRTTRGPIPSATPSQTNLFFSPTASGASAGMNTSANRDSRFLPSGFYASSSPLPAAHGHNNSISLTNLRPASRGQAAGSTPPESPSLGPRTTPVQRNMSTSTVNLNYPPGGRAPSAFLDDLLDEQPGMFPPAAGGQHHSPSSSNQGRY